MIKKVIRNLSRQYEMARDYDPVQTKLQQMEKENPSLNYKGEPSKLEQGIFLFRGLASKYEGEDDLYCSVYGNPPRADVSYSLK